MQIKALRPAFLHVGPSDLQDAVFLNENRALSQIITALGIQNVCVPKKITYHLSLLLPPFLDHLEFFTYALLTSQTKRSFLSILLCFPRLCQPPCRLDRREKHRAARAAPPARLDEYRRLGSCAQGIRPRIRRRV